MNGIKNGVLFALLCTVLACYGITVQDVQRLDKNKFFGAWSQFLDQILEAKEDPVSDENEALYKAFIQHGKTLNMPKVTGNKDAIVHMQKQMHGIKKRMTSQKKFFDAWDQLHTALESSQQYPLSPENEESYQLLIRQAKDLGVKKTFVQEMHKKINDIKQKLKATVVVPEEPVQEEVVSEEPVEYPIIDRPEGEEESGKESVVDTEDATKKENITKQPEAKEDPQQEA